MKSMTTRRLIAACSATAALLGLTVSAHASLVTTSFAGTVVDFSQFSGPFAFGAGPVAVGGLVGANIDWSSSSPSAVIGNGGYGLGGNGSWGGGRNGYTGLNNVNAPGGYTQFIFNDGPVSSVGGFVNYATCGSSQCDPAQQFIIEALDAFNNAIETYNVSVLAAISTPSATDAGAFRGIVRANSDIYGFRLYNAVHVLDDLTFTRSNSVPEPATLALVGLALAGLGVSRRRRAA
jgi:hypothetical protein